MNENTTVGLNSTIEELYPFRDLLSLTCLNVIGYWAVLFIQSIGPKLFAVLPDILRLVSKEERKKNITQ